MSLSAGLGDSFTADGDVGAPRFKAPGMSVERVFLDWDGPCLKKAIAWLADRFPPSFGCWNLRDLTVVLPGGRAERRFVELLVLFAEENDWWLIPPARCTGGRLPELLYHPERPFASSLQCRLSWIETLKATKKETLEQLFGKNEELSLLTLWSWAAKIEELWSELTASGLSFDQVLVGECRLLESFPAERWEALAKIQEEFTAKLKDLGFSEKNSERLKALKEKRCSSERTFCLVGMADLLPLAREMLAQTASAVFTVVYAPETLAQSFDDFGVLKTASWLNTEVKVSEEQVRFALNPAGQAALLVQSLADFENKLSPDQITVGVCDKSFTPQLERELALHGITPRSAEGKSFRETRIYSVLSILSKYLRSFDFEEFAALVRHPDIELWLREAGESFDPTEIDNYYLKHFPPKVQNVAKASSTARIREALNKLLSSFEQSKKKPLQDWSKTIVGFLSEVYQTTTKNRPSSSKKAIIDACEVFVVAAQEMFLLKTGTVQATASEAINLLLLATSDKTIPEDAKEQAVELLGWLELLLDDAPGLVITGFNEGLVPESVNSDSFLPNQLRRSLGLFDNDRRYARDAFTLSAILHSRPEAVIIAGQCSAANDMLMPSRLLLASDPETNARRLLRFYEKQSKPPVARLNVQSELEFKGEPPLPEQMAAAVTSMSVTSFADYLKCPYRFYLRHILKLRSLDDSIPEMDPSTFGTVTHEVLREFGERSSEFTEASVSELSQFLYSLLEKQAVSRFGDERLPAVALQLEQLRWRLNIFAKWQTEWFAKGWQIRHVELEFKDNPAPLPLGDDRSIFLTGKIDRVDFNPQENRWIVFDYKTGGNSKKPKDTHQTKEGWIDLQLPLYHELLRQHGVAGKLDLGYLNIGKEETLKEAIAEWSEEELAQAIDVARKVGRAVLDGKFWPPSFEHCQTDDFSSLCGVGLLRDKSVLAEADE